MPNGWDLWMATKEGVTLCDLNETLGFEFSKVVNGVGTFEIILPPNFDATLMLAYNRVEVWREFPGLTALVFAGLVRGWGWETDRKGATTFFIKGRCVNHLLRRRILLREYST